MEQWQGVINAKEVARLYNDLTGQWLLLELIEVDEKGKAEKFKLVANHFDKDELYKLMDSDNWDWDKKYLFVFADPNNLCEI
ncbi:MAG: hypothetical protein J7M01_02860 [Candidatus Marinimicrobia bacterium]|nr:hypothetical protein [Candidatus Neomarinimicrobiota bacterium]